MKTLFEMHVICGEPYRRCAGGNTAVMLKKLYFWIHARTVFARILEQEECKFWCEKIKSFRRRIRNFCSSNVGVFETCRRCYEQKVCSATQMPLTDFDFSTEISSIFLSHKIRIFSKPIRRTFELHVVCCEGCRQRYERTEAPNDESTRLFKSRHLAPAINTHSGICSPKEAETLITCILKSLRIAILELLTSSE